MTGAPQRPGRDELREEGRPEGDRLHVVAADEAAVGVEPRLVRDDTGHRLAAPHLHRLVELAPHRAGGVAHVVAPHLPGGVREPVRVLGRPREQQQAGRLDRVAGHADDGGALAAQRPVAVHVEHAGRPPRGVVLDLRDVAVGTQVEVARLLGLRQLGDQRRPLRAVLVALEVEAVLDAGRAAVVGLGVGRVRPGRVVPVAELLGAACEDLVVVVRGQRRAAVAMGDAHLDLGLVVVGLELRQRDRPVEQARAVEVAVGRARGELVGLEAGAGACPVGRGPADGLDQPRGQTGEVGGHLPAARRGARVAPRHLPERGPLVLVVVLAGEVRPGLQDDGLEPPLAELVGHRAAAGPGADHHHDVGVVVLEARHAVISSSCSMRGSGSQSRSSKPRLM